MRRDSLCRRGMRALAAGVAWSGALAGQVLAQQPAPPPAAAPAGGFTRPLWTEAAITVIFIGLALFAVCRNSNRS